MKIGRPGCLGEVELPMPHFMQTVRPDTQLVYWKPIAACAAPSCVSAAQQIPLCCERPVLQTGGLVIVESAIFPPLFPNKT